MTHSVIPEMEREKMGITHSLLRLSVGLEHSDDIIGDLQQAFAKVEDTLCTIASKIKALLNGAVVYRTFALDTCSYEPTKIKRAR